MALVKQGEVNIMNNNVTTPTANENAAPPSSRGEGQRPTAANRSKTSTTLHRPVSRELKSGSKLPERQLLSRYRHVYAGKGGWFVSRTSYAPPVNFNSSSNSQYLDVYRKGMILRISQNIFDSSKQSIKKNTVVSNKVIGDDQRSSKIDSTGLTLKLKEPPQHKIGLKGENVPELIADKDLRLIQQEDPDYNRSHIHDNGNESVHTKVKELSEGIGVKNVGSSSKEENIYTRQLENEEDYINTELNGNDNCFITSFRRAHTIIGTIDPRDNQPNGSCANQLEKDKHTKLHEHEVSLQREKLTNKPNNIINENICEVNTVDIRDINDKKKDSLVNSDKNKKRRKDKYALGELEFNVLRQRSFVKLPSKMAVVEQRPFSRGPLTRSGKRLMRGMSQEALLAINETKKEMGIEIEVESTEDKFDSSGDDCIQPYSNEVNRVSGVDSNEAEIRLQGTRQDKRDIDDVDNLVSESHDVTTNNNVKNVPNSVVNQKLNSSIVHKSHLQQPSCDSFASTMDSRTPPNGALNNSKRLSKSCAKKPKFHVFTAEEIRQQLKSNALKKSSSSANINKGNNKSTEATPISPELGLMPPVGMDRKQDSARYSFNLSQEKSHSHRYNGNKRYFSNNGKLSKDNSLSQSSVFLNSPRTKLPHLKLASKSQEDVRLEAQYTTRSRNSSRIKSPPEIPEEKDDVLAPLNKKNLPQWKYGGGMGLTKEKSFQITPPGWDVRYRDIYGKKGHVDFNDDTPEEVKERAIEKCSDWLVKYM